MTECVLYPKCGGCCLRELGEDEYKQHKEKSFKYALRGIKQEKIQFDAPIFIADGTRRRAEMAFSYIKKKLQLGFNVSRSHEIIDCEKCPLLTPKLNNALSFIRQLLECLCAEPYHIKRGKTQQTKTMTEGSVFLCEADNGIDVLLEAPFLPELGHRMIISELASKFSEIIRISWKKEGFEPETVFEKTQPIIENSGISVYIPVGTFLQASKEGEKALIRKVLEYTKGYEGKIADLFCGVGTFSYPLAQNKKNKILAVDSSVALLKGFQQSINRNQITNITIETRNLFKYPLTKEELKSVNVVIFDPPRAGGAKQVKEIVCAEVKPLIIVAVSCNPHTFVNDANALIEGGYTLKEITMVDQFVYSNHTELVALFERKE